jgi:hypothetical protein
MFEVSGKNCNWSFVDLSQLVENEGQKHLPHFQETGRPSRRR